MNIGVSLPNWSDAQNRVPHSRLVSYAQKAEQLGFSGLWMGDHLLSPDTYDHSLMEPLTTLSHIAGETDTIPLGTSILVLTLRNPIVAAKQVANMQYLSQGRITVGVGLGYYKPEFDAVDVPYEARGRVLTESLELFIRLLNERSVTYDGELYDVEDVTIHPQLGRVPRILYGGSGVVKSSEGDYVRTGGQNTDTDTERFVPTAIKNRMAMVDGWLAHGETTEALRQDWAEFADYLEEHGQNPEKKDKVGATNVYIEPNADTETATQRQLRKYEQFLSEDRGREYARTHYITGSVEDVRDRLQTYDDQGFDELVAYNRLRSLDELDRQLHLWTDNFPEYF